MQHMPSKMDKHIDQSSLPMFCKRQDSNDIALEDFGSVSSHRMEPRGSNNICDSLKHDEEGNTETNETMLAKHLFHVHASHCEGCQFIKEPIKNDTTSPDGHAVNHDDEDSNSSPARKYLRKDDGRVHNGRGPIGWVAQKTDPRYTESATLRYQPRKKPIPAPISMPSDSSQTVRYNQL